MKEGSRSRYEIREAAQAVVQTEDGDTHASEASKSQTTSSH